jgi:hypothetical protein
MVSPNDRLRLPPPWISPAAGMPDREVRPVIIVQRRRLLYPSYVQDYLDRVTAADVAAGNTSGLEVGVTDGANTFIQDLVSDTYLGVSGGVISQAASVIKASVPMAGARTRLGAMTPLVGPAPTSFNFGNNDYSRKTGLVADGNAKYLDSNRNNNADPQNSKHIAAFITATAGTGPTVVMGTNTVASGGSWVTRNADNTTSSQRANSAASYSYANAFPISSKLIGVSRSASAAQSHIAAGGVQSSTLVSVAPVNENILVFRALGLFSPFRQAFYSIGENLDLAILDARVTSLINAYAAAIP